MKIDWKIKLLDEYDPYKKDGITERSFITLIRL